MPLLRRGPLPVARDDELRPARKNRHRIDNTASGVGASRICTVLDSSQVSHLSHMPRRYALSPTRTNFHSALACRHFILSKFLPKLLVIISVTLLGLSCRAGKECLKLGRSRAGMLTSKTAEWGILARVCSALPAPSRGCSAIATASTSGSASGSLRRQPGAKYHAELEKKLRYQKRSREFASTSGSARGSLRRPPHCSVTAAGPAGPQLASFGTRSVRGQQQHTDLHRQTSTFPTCSSTSSRACQHQGAG